MRVLRGRGTALEREYPLGVVRQCVGPAVRRESDAERILRGAARLAGPALLDVTREANPTGPAPHCASTVSTICCRDRPGRPGLALAAGNTSTRSCAGFLRFAAGSRGCRSRASQRLVPPPRG